MSGDIKMLKIDMDLIKQLEKNDKVFVTWLNLDGKPVTKKGTFHSIDGCDILVKPPHSKKRVWIIPTNSNVEIKKA